MKKLKIKKIKIFVPVAKQSKRSYTVPTTKTN